MVLTKEKISKNIAYLTIFLIPFYFFRFEILGIPTNILEIFIALLFLISLLALLSSKAKPIFGPIWPYIFLLSALIAAAISPDKEKAFGILKGWFFVPFILYWSVINIFKPKEISRLIIPLYLSNLAIALWAIAQKVGLLTTAFYQKSDASFVQYVKEDRIFGPFESPNYLAMFLVPTLILSIYLFKDIKSKWKKTLYIASLILPLTAIYFSGSKAGLIALTSSLVSLAFLYLGPKIKNKAYIWIAGLALIVLTIITFSKINFNSASNEIRKEIYTYSKSMIIDHPILGIGLGNFQPEITQYSKGNFAFQTWGVPYALHPHNVFLAIWLNLGLLGIISFFGIIYLFIKKLIRKNAVFESLILIAAMLSILIHGFFDTTYFKNDLSAIFWLIIAFSIILVSNDKNTSKN